MPRYFQRNQYLIGDSAYQLTRRMITPFKKPFRAGLSKPKKAFNMRLSKLRIRIEHTIGILKARFGCLRCLPNPSRLNQDTLQWCYAWIVACAVLHNILLDFNDPWKPSQEQQLEILQEEQELTQREASRRATVEGVGVTLRDGESLSNSRHDREARRDRLYNEFLQDVTT